LNGCVWITDKHGFISVLLSSEMRAKMQNDPGEIYKELTRKFGVSFYGRIEAKATPAPKEKLSKILPDIIK